MPDHDSSISIAIIIDQPCWNSISHWQELIRLAAEEALHQFGWTQPTEISILLTDNHKIQQLNMSHRGLDQPTNVLSFPSLEPTEIAYLNKQKKDKRPILLGDVALAFEIIQQESLAQNKPFEEHLTHLVIHGVLHLLGLDHVTDEDAAIMESLEIKILNSLNIPSPYQE